MPKAGAVLLSDYPGKLIRLACTGCERSGQYRRSTLAEQHGADAGLPELLGHLVAQSGCDRRGNMSTPCGAFYVDLAPGRSK